MSAGKECPACGHEHRGEAMAFICVGCPCPRRHGEVTVLDRIIAADDAAAKADEPKPVPVLPGQRRLF